MKTLLIDGDSLAYRIPHAHRNIMSTSPDEIEGDFEGIEDTSDNWAVAAIQKELDYFMKLTKCDSYELHLTASKRLTESFIKRYGMEPKFCFRYKEAEALSKGYKSNRKSDPIEGYEEVMTAMIEQFNSEVHDYWEADDAVVALKTAYPEKYRLCALDKDVLNQVAGEHFNYGRLEMHFVSEEDARFYKYWQCIVGDPGDGYGGVPGIGKAKAAKFINPEMSEDELWDAVVSLYEEKKLGLAEAIATMRLASMQQLSVVRDSSGGFQYSLTIFEPS